MYLRQKKIVYVFFSRPLTKCGTADIKKKIIKLHRTAFDLVSSRLIDS